MKLASFPTWAEAREALALMKAVYPDDDFFVALIFSQPGIYEGTFEEGGRALPMRHLEWAADEIAYT
jgi:hypothetical protein